MKEFLRSLTPVFRREFVRKITSAFRDVAELKQNISSLRETMETQRLLIDHQSRSLESYRQQLIDRQQRLDALQDQMDARLTQLSAQLQQMDDQAKQLDANLLQQTSKSQRQRFETAAKLDRIHQDHDGQQLKLVAQGEAFAEQKRFLASLARTVSSYFLQSLSNGSASAPQAIGPAVSPS